VAYSLIRRERYIYYIYTDYLLSMGSKECVHATFFSINPLDNPL